MSDRESDIEFEFFEEPETGEATPAERPSRRRGSRPPVRPPTGLTPLLRLVGLISFAILVVVLLVFWVNGCREDRRKSAYVKYIEKVAQLGARSQAIGVDLNNLLTSRGKKEAEVEQELTGFAQQQEQLVGQARETDVPGPLREQHRHVIEALELRVSGLNGMADAFHRTAGSKSASQAGTLLAEQAKRLIASDVVWEDLFKTPAATQLDRQHVSDVNVPDSIFVSDVDLVTARSLTDTWSRIHGASTGGESCEPRGTGLVSVTALPSRQELSTTTTNTIESTKDLAFAATVENSGCAQETRIPVTLTIQKSPNPIEKTVRIDLINQGDQKTVVFRDLGTPPFAERTSITVEVQAVPKEANTKNNSAEYPAIFSFG